MRVFTAALDFKIRKPIAALLALFLAVALAGIMPGLAAHAVPASDDLRVDPYLVDAKYRGVAVDVKVLNGAVTDATSVRVTVHRAGAPDVVKVSKEPTVATLNSGSAVTAPIVIQPGTYDEAGSSSWVKPEDVIWTAETVPTSVTVEVLTGDAVVLSKTVDAPTTGPTGATMESVLPALPSLSPVSATYRNSDYKGVSVKFAVEGFVDAEQVLVRVDRSDGSSVTKIGKESVLNTVNDGKFHSLTSPIVIQQGTYNEVGSNSWYMPTAVWTSETAPVSVTLTITRTYGPDAVITWATIDGSADGVLPAPSEPVRITVPADQPDGSFDVVIPEGETGGELALGTPDEAAVTVPVEVNVVSPLGVEVTIPAETTVTAEGPGAETWDGVIQLPTIVEEVEIPDSPTGQEATVALAIEVGSDTVRLTFDQPVKLVLVGQAGKKAGFVQGGVFTAIDAQCASSEPSLVDGECWLNEDGDLVIWTTHFTTFVAYGLAAAALPATGSADAGPLLVIGVLVLLAGAGLLLVVRRRVAA